MSKSKWRWLSHFNDPSSQNHKLHNLIYFCDDQYLSDTYLSIMVKKDKKCHNFVLSASKIFGTKNKSLVFVICLCFKEKFKVFCLYKNILFSHEKLIDKIEYFRNNIIKYVPNFLDILNSNYFTYVLPTIVYSLLPKDTDLLPTKYQQITKKSNFDFLLIVGILSVISRYFVGNKLYPIVGIIKNR